MKLNPKLLDVIEEFEYLGSKVTTDGRFKSKTEIRGNVWNRIIGKILCYTLFSNIVDISVFEMELTCLISPWTWKLS